MRTDFRLEQKAERRATWLRLIAMMCVLLISVAGTVEVCHSHTDISASTKNSQKNAPGRTESLSAERGDALRVARASAHADPEPELLQIQKVLFKAVELEKRLQQWNLELFSRPSAVCRVPPGITDGRCKKAFSDPANSLPVLSSENRISLIAHTVFSQTGSFYADASETIASSSFFFSSSRTSSFLWKRQSTSGSVNGTVTDLVGR